MAFWGLLLCGAMSMSLEEAWEPASLLPPPRNDGSVHPR